MALRPQEGTVPLGCLRWGLATLWPHVLPGLSHCWSSALPGLPLPSPTSPCSPRPRSWNCLRDGVSVCPSRTSHLELIQEGMMPPGLLVPVSL